MASIGRFAGLLVLAWALLTAGVFAEVPRLRTATLENMHEADQGITRPMVVDRTGHRYVLKANVPTMLRGNLAVKYGNFEAEIIAFKVFELMGLRSPEVHVVQVEGKPDLHLRIRFADASFSRADAATPVNKTEIGDADAIDLDAARKIALVDLLIGNPDRHEGNILVYKNATGAWMPIPIDHNFALVTAAITGVESWGLTPIPAADAAKSEMIAYGDRFLTFKYRNKITIRAVRGAEGHAGLLAHAARLRTALSDEALTRIVRSVPPEAIVGRPADERFAELTDLLRARRDALPGFLERYFAAGGAP